MENKQLILGATIIGLVLLIGVLGIQAFLQPEEAFVKTRPNININEVAYKVAVGKPETILFEGATNNAGEKSSSEVTVYNQDLALVKDVRKIFMEKGLNIVQFKDIAAKIDATSVFFRDISNASTFVVEQNYEYDLVSKQKILEKYLDREITVETTEGQESKTYKGTLLSYADGILLETSEGIVTLPFDAKVTFPELPGGLLTKPTLVWKIFSETIGERLTETIYLTAGMNWRADYIAVVNKEDKNIDFKGWTTITNNSGTSYPDTKLKLVAGDVHRVVQSPKYRELYDYAVSEGAAAPQQYGQEELFEYYLYTLDRKTNIGNNETKQISLLASDNIPVNKEFVYDGQANGTKVQVKLNFKNSESQGLGIPLPKGIVRVYKQDSDGQLQFIGEDQIDHTKKEDDLELFLGNAFDVTGERTQVTYENISKGFYRGEYKIILENQKSEAIKVKVKENLGGNWTITKNSHAYDKKNSSEVEFNVDVPAKGETTITYTVEYRYYY
ncbi:MAG: DUF4139 domain-containing protein [Candidatus Diapherotrites archaeon CG11_big_fil_rev_8_21_14_0_20_37_9]|nr:MAG: DUF4139 domain-containing protein [Candidatus Diapherotrites archaeon CG11_big_fil_rev_8_21_14_0_20_37_9]